MAGILFLLPLQGEAGIRCDRLFLETPQKRPVTISRPETLFDLTEEQFIKELQEVLTPQSSLHDPEGGPSKAEQDVQQLEAAIHMKLPPQQREHDLRMSLRIRTSDNYLMVINGPSSTDLNRAWSVDAYEIQEQPDHAFYGKILKIPLVEMWYEKAIGTESRLAKMTIDQEHIYSFFVGRAPREWTNYESNKATVRVLRRGEQNPTIIERYADENQIPITKFRNQMRKAEESGYTVYEIGRVSNLTQNPLVMFANRLLMAYYIIRSNPQSLFVLATSSEKLVKYYQKWGFTLSETMRKDDSSQEFYLMSATAKDFLNALSNP